jgi:hypothetical protein
MAGLEDLVPDVLYILLLKAPSIHTLWGYIRASPRMYDVFRTYRDLILSTVITRDIGHEILGEAQSALDSSRFEAQGLLKSEAMEWISDHKDILIGLASLPLPSLGSETLPLRRVHQDVKFFAELYVQERFHILGGVKPTRTSGVFNLDILSDTEKTRIYRAIYRYAIYGDLFRFDYDRHIGHKRVKVEFPSAYDQNLLFLCQFPAWQVEELSCINDFIQDKTLEKWEELESDFFDKIKNDPACWDVDRNPYDSRWELDFFGSSAKSAYHKEWQKYSATLSLPQLREVFSATGDHLLQVIRKNTRSATNDFLTEALDADPYHDSEEYDAYLEALNSGVKVQFQEDNIEEPNEAWLWAHQYRPCDFVESAFHFPIGEGLRRFGYVFWDSKRLHDTNILDQKLVLHVLPQRAYFVSH